MRALERVIGILEAVAESGDTATASVVADRMGLSLSTTARLMREMADQAMLERNGHGYSIGTRLLSIVQTAGPSEGLSGLATPVMMRLRDQTGETVSLHVRRFDQRVCTAVCESAHPIRRVVPVGFVLPLHLGATGDVLMSGLTEEELTTYLAGLYLSSTEEKTLRERIEVARRQGYAIAEQRWTEGLSGISAAITHQGAVVAVISVSGPADRWNAAAMEASREDVVGAASAISERIRPTTRLTD
ncbi:MAG TPA: IclR family transcriptional regulator [Capillimicrobium sp.]|nr:IclR family transcriptional regulator [Capillimicrobium sp.]